MNNDPVCALDEIHTRNSGASLYMTKFSARAFSRFSQLHCWRTESILVMGSKYTRIWGESIASRRKSLNMYVLVYISQYYISATIVLEALLGLLRSCVQLGSHSWSVLWQSTAIVLGISGTYRETAEQLKLHSLCSLWAPTHLTQSIRARRKVIFEDWLSSTSHICKDSLSKMPSKKFIRGSIGIIVELLIKVFACNVTSILRKTNDFIIILQILVAENSRMGVCGHTSGLIEIL